MPFAPRHREVGSCAAQFVRNDVVIYLILPLNLCLVVSS